MSFAVIHIGHFVDLAQRRIYPAAVHVQNGRISRIETVPEAPPDAGFLLPGMTDAHVHVESSMLPPTEFARMAVVHGTVATVSDPHEIANVLGEEGVRFMLEDGERSPLKFCFGAPSCVPSTVFETAGAAIDAAAVERMLQNPAIGYLSEMMNFPGVLHQEAGVMAKIAAAKRIGKPIDGHAPGLRGATAQQYFAAGISTDHECFTLEEGREKAQLGVKILIREGSAARNFEALWPLIQEFPQQVMFCSDDKHPDDLVHGHINQLAARAIAKGCDLFDVLHAACIHPVLHYRLPVGLMRPGDPADFIRVADLRSFQVLETWIDGREVARHGQCLLPKLEISTPNQFLATPIDAADFQLRVPEGQSEAVVIDVWDGEIITGKIHHPYNAASGSVFYPDTEADVLYITVVNRYAAGVPPAMGLVRGFGLKKGALAGSIAHDSHNLLAVGTDSAALAAAVNAVIEAGGGISACDGAGDVRLLPLPIAGLMSSADGWELAGEYSDLDAWVKSALGCTLRAPFMSLSFMALPVIPALKITDKGLFDVERFDFVQA